jgi:hypothetical protein
MPALPLNIGCQGKADIHRGCLLANVGTRVAQRGQLSTALIGMREVGQSAEGRLDLRLSSRRPKQTIYWLDLPSHRVSAWAISATVFITPTANECRKKTTPLDLKVANRQLCFASLRLNA